MTDGRVDADFELWQRRRDVEDMKRAAAADAAAGVRLGRKRGYLTAEEAAARREARQADAGTLAVTAPGETAAGTLAPPREAPADPQASLRATRLGFVAAAVLVLFLLWIRQRRNL